MSCEVPRKGGYIGDHLLVVVTPDDIVIGQQVNNYYCPIALAVARAAGVQGDELDVSVSPDQVRVHTSPSHWVEYSTPPGMAEWMGRFDFEGPEAVKPMEWELAPCRRGEVRV